MEKWLVLARGQEMYKIELEYLAMTQNKKVIKDQCAVTKIKKLRSQLKEVYII